MAKIYPLIYASANDAIALEQRFYIKEEATRGTMVFPLATDFLFHLPGGSIGFEQPFESSPQRSGRHHSNIIKKKKVSSFTLSTYFNIDEAAVSGLLAIDTPVKLLWKSLLGVEDATGPDLFYNAGTAPNATFTMYECGDKWARQTPGGFIMGGNVQLPGDGEATTEWSGNGKTTYLAGIAKSVTANAANIITVAAGEGFRYTVGAAVMIIKYIAGVQTLSADTPAATPRRVTAVTSTTVTVDGAVLADASGVVDPVYLVYHEPLAPTAINNPVTGLVGDVTIVGLANQCVRSLGLNFQNNHELVDYCFGEDGLGGTLFVPGDRLTVEVTMSMNLNHEVLAFFIGLLDFPTKNIVGVLGNVAGRNVTFTVPSARFMIPAFSVPDTGSIPVEFSGTAYETAFGLADEVEVRYN